MIFVILVKIRSNPRNNKVYATYIFVGQSIFRRFFTFKIVFCSKMPFSLEQKKAYRDLKIRCERKLCEKYCAIVTANPDFQRIC